MLLAQKKILLCVTGGIAAYKTPFLVRLLVKEGAEVKIILSPAARDFVTPKTLSVLSRNPVYSNFFDEDGVWNNHVHLAEWADVIVVTPLTANTLAKMVSGACDNLLLATYLSGWKKVLVSPAMDRDMYLHPGVQNNLTALASYGTSIIPPEDGELASGLHGQGRMAEPETILQHIKNHFSKTQKLAGKKALVNAGPTYEPIDPVRFIGNHSSGKMGIAIAETLAGEGAEVTLVLGPSSQVVNNANIKVIRVQSSSQMYEAMLFNYEVQDIAVCAAAVADYAPAEVSLSKIKKKENNLQLQLVKTKDVLAELGRLKKKQLLVGFALETNDVLAYAQQKLEAKNLDMIIANSAVEQGSGFGGDTNKITIIDRHNKITKFELKSKEEVAKDITEYIVTLLPQTNN